ncbi:MAG: hypothetical protein U0573_09790 [Phycisphaerales bacterium]|nr:hypothetical protein [Planctomycetota bacterium]
MASTQEAKSSLLSDMDAPPQEKKARSVDSDSSGRTRLIATIAFLAVSLAVLGYVAFSSISSYRNDPRRLARFSVVKDSETGEVIKEFPLPDEGYPAVNPKTGKRTIYPAEACYWTKEGKAKLDPTYVILNAWFGKKDVTRCPDCGRTVTKSNPMPPDALMQKAWDDANRK